MERITLEGMMESMMESMMMSAKRTEKPKGKMGAGRDWTREMLELSSSAPYVGCLRISENNCTWRLTRELHGLQHQFVVTSPSVGMLKHWARSQGAWALDQGSSLTDWAVTAKMWSKAETLGSLRFRYIETSHGQRRSDRRKNIASAQHVQATVTTLTDAPAGIAEELAQLRSLVKQIAAHVFAMRDHEGNLGRDQA